MCKIEAHNFYCMKCGNLSYPLFRKSGRRREKFHRKNLYCPHCKIALNHIECKNLEEEKEFKELFEKDYFFEEVEKELIFLYGKK